MIIKKGVLLLFCLPMLFSCGRENNTNRNTKTEVDLCRCLTEPGNTDWAKENGEDCDKAISNKIGVPNWKSINFSQNTSLSAKWDNMVNDCVNNQLENDSKESSSQEISFEEAKLSINDIDGEQHVIFKPNTIAYAVPTNSEEGQKILNAKTYYFF